tara:strand:+ start:376 stop:696 length:321 start_codon:yes stop_codon:yes gene_type:complete
MKFKKDRKLHIRRLDKVETIHAFKMMGNEYRMNMLLLLKEHPHLTLDQINEHVGGDFKNISTHMKKLSTAGLVDKKYLGNYVQHTLTEYGKRSVQCYNLFLKELDI